MFWFFETFVDDQFGASKTYIWDVVFASSLIVGQKLCGSKFVVLIVSLLSEKVS